MHARQADEIIMPLPVEYVPATQLMQTLDMFAPAPVL
jgi:hypothetical protein